MGNYKEAVKLPGERRRVAARGPGSERPPRRCLLARGREREARFQWDQALTLKPEPDDADKIRKKLTKGLPTQAQAAKKTREVKAEPPVKKRTATKSVPARVQ